MAPGAKIKERYVLGRFPLAHKGMGEVWPAHDTLLERPVIVKFINTALMDADLVRRFRREALLTARFDHPGVPAIYDLGEDTGRPYVVLQKINGIALSDLVAEQGPLPIGWIAAIGAQISSVLLAAKRLGLVHRDIKPSNVMLDHSGAVKVLDFGLAVALDDERLSRITRTGQSLGTVGYMAPEQIHGERPDHRTDLYGLGATLFDLLTGRPPFDGVTTVTTVQHQLTAPPPRPSAVRPDVPAVLDDLVHALLALHPEDRPPTAADVYKVLTPLSQNLQPIPGLLDDTAEAVQAYAAIVGRVPPQDRSSPPVTADQTELDLEQALRDAERLHADGQFRAAARHWRRLAEDLARRYGDDDPRVFDLERRAALAHVALGEHGRALRQLDSLLQRRIRAHGSDHEAVLDLRHQIAQLSQEQTPSPAPSREPPAADR